MGSSTRIQGRRLSGKPRWRMCMATRRREAVRLGHWSVALCFQVCFGSAASFFCPSLDSDQCMLHVMPSTPTFRNLDVWHLHLDIRQRERSPCDGKHVVPGVGTLRYRLVGVVGVKGMAENGVLRLPIEVSNKNAVPGSTTRKAQSM